MKLVPIVLCFIVLTLGPNLAENKNFLQGFFNKLHTAGEKVKADIHNFSEKVRSDIQNAVKSKSEKRDNISGTDKVTFKDDGEVVIFSTSSTSRPTTAEEEEGRMVFPTEETLPTFTPARPDVPVVTTPNSANSGNTSTSDNKDPKQNFVGGCLKGFLPTADGRCMPTY